MDAGGTRYLGLARIVGDDGPVGHAVAESRSTTSPTAGFAPPQPRAARIPPGPPAFSLADVGVFYGDVRGQVRFHGQDLYSRDIDPVQVRRRIGMVFQKPNPFPKSIYDNVAFGPRTLGMDDHLDERVEEALRRAALWQEVSGRLRRNAFSLSGGQQQRLVIARALATRPDVLLMDEPASALDPFSTARIEDLMLALRDELTIVVVTHNMQQAARVADMTAFMTVEDGVGTLVEYAPTETIFTAPRDARTEAYVTGRFG